jgi:hypothetical protein
MKRTKRFVSTLLLGIIVTSLLLTLGTVTVQSTPNSQKFWALVVSCARPGEMSLHATGAYMYHVLSEHYDFDGLYYLHSDPSFPGVNDTATLENTKSAITEWLYNVSGPNDVVFIYFNTHGSGYYNNGDPTNPHEEDMGSRPGDDGDDNRDEALSFWNGAGWDKYWDDELADDLANETFSYNRLVLATQSCFGGGLIYDIQARPHSERRAILTATSEQLTAYTNLDCYKDPPEEDGYCEWSEVFIDALHGEDTYWDDDSNEVVHQNVTVNADFNDDGHVTLWEAWNYTTYKGKHGSVKDDAMNHTFIEEVKDWWPTPELPIPDYAVPEEPQISNSALAYNIWFPKKGGPRLLTVQTCLTNGTELTGMEFWIDDDPTTFNTPHTTDVPMGDHTIEIQDSLIDGNYEYTFQYWDHNNSSDNPLTVNVPENIVLTAHYAKTFLGDCHYHGNVNYPGSHFHWTYVELGYGIDLQIDQIDLDLMSLAFGMFEWEPRGVGEGLYNPDADVNEDGIVDIGDISLACMYLGTSCEEYWDGYKYSKKTTGRNVEEIIDFYNRTDFVVCWGQEKYVNGEKVLDTYDVADWDPVWAFPISNSTQGKRFFEEGWFYFGP